MIFRIELIKNKKYVPLAKRINEHLKDPRVKHIFLYGHQYEWAKAHFNAYESEPGVFEQDGVRFMKQVRGMRWKN